MSDWNDTLGNEILFPAHWNNMVTDQLSRLGPVAVVTAYGAYGDDSHDDTVAIQAAIDAAGAGVVYFPSGTYIVTGLTVSTVGASLIGSGKKDAIIKLTTGANRKAVSISEDHCMVSRLGFESSGSRTDGNKTTGIYIESSPAGSIGYGVIEHVTMSGFSSAHIRINGCLFMSIANAYMTAGHRGIWLDGTVTSGTTFSIRNIYFTGFQATDNRYGVVTVDAGTDVFTGFTPDHYAPVKFSTTGTLPAPLDAAIVYFTRDVSGNTFKVAATFHGTAIDITDTGTGVHTAKSVGGAGIYMKSTSRGLVRDCIFEYCESGVFLDSSSRAEFFGLYFEENYLYDVLSLDSSKTHFGQVRVNKGNSDQWHGVAFASRYTAEYERLTLKIRDAHIQRNLVANTLNFAADAEASDTYAITLTPAPTKYTTGMMIVFTANTANTGACTVNVNGLGAKSLKMLHDQDPGNNYIESGSVVVAVYDGTNFQMIQPAAN